MKKGQQSEKLKGNKNAKRGEHGSIVARLPVSLVDDLHKCLELEGEYSPDRARIVEYALGIIEGYTRGKIEHNETYIL